MLSINDFNRKNVDDTLDSLSEAGCSERKLEELEEMAADLSEARKGQTDAAARIGEAGGEKHLTEAGYQIPDEFRSGNVAVNNGAALGGRDGG